jgi:hypothetical protein
MYRQNQLAGMHFYNWEGWHTVKAEVSTGAFLVETVSRKGEHVSQRIWRTKEIGSNNLFADWDQMHAAELAVGK